MVDDAGVIVRVPAPLFCTSVNQPVMMPEPEPGCGSVAAMGPELENVTSVPHADATKEYELPV
ncbi:MAG TPA: hypothetical protein VN924_11185 [Bryobacteraceae bacterium]|nr:hypothetical protein [Bryobacteraceae bacterium]